MVVANRPSYRKMNEITLRMRLKELRMQAQDFCDRWFGLDDLPPEEREAERQVRGYRAKCVRLLAEVLQKKDSTVDKWGANFERMPPDHEPTLAYADALRLQMSATPESLMKLFLDRRNES